MHEKRGIEKPIEVGFSRLYKLFPSSFKIPISLNPLRSISTYENHTVLQRLHHLFTIQHYLTFKQIVDRRQDHKVIYTSTRSRGVVKGERRP